MTIGIKTIQWNIGGGKIREQGADATRSGSYNKPSLDYIIEMLRQQNADIITVQEAHADDSLDQVAAIAAALGYSYASDFYSESHIEKGQRLGQGIISRFPLSDHQSELFINPNVTVTWQNGVTATTHDKGITACTLNINGTLLHVKTLSLIPFDPFNVEPLSERAKPIFADVSLRLQDSSEHLLIQGDFNLGKHDPSLQRLLPELIGDKTREVSLTKPTIPFGEKPDRVVYRGMHLQDHEIIDAALTDHYPIVVQFEL